MALFIEGLTRTYPGRVVALDRVTLTIEPGVFGLLGPNGAGKSTLMRILATLQHPDSGNVFFDEIDVLRDPMALRRTLGYLPQDFGFYPNVAAESILDHFAVLKGYGNKAERRAVVEAKLLQVNLWDVRKKSVGGYSGGMRQRLGIAIALLGNPRLVIVDEPTAGLDPVERNRFLNLLADIGNDAVVLLSTHIVEDIAALCERVGILVRGRVAATGSPGEIVAPLRGRIWRKDIARGARGIEEETRLSETLEILSRRLIAGAPTVSVFAERSPGVGFSPAEPDLEDAYFFHLRAVAPTPAPASGRIAPPAIAQPAPSTTQPETRTADAPEPSPAPRRDPPGAFDLDLDDEPPVREKGEGEKGQGEREMGDGTAAPPTPKTQHPTPTPGESSL